MYIVGTSFFGLKRTKQTNSVSLQHEYYTCIYMYTGVVLTWGRLPCCAGVSLYVLPRAAESSVGGADPLSETAHRCQKATWCSHCSGCPNAPFADTQTHWKTLMINTLVPYSSINATREVINYSQCALLLLSNHFFFYTFRLTSSICYL